MSPQPLNAVIVRFIAIGLVAFRSLFILTSILTAHQSVAELLIDTGAGVSQNPLLISSSLGTDRNFAAGQISFQSPVQIHSLSIYMLAPVPPPPQDTMTVSIVSDDGSDIPGNNVLASMTTTIEGLFFVRWVDFVGFDTALGPGRYWITLTVDATSNFWGSLILDPPKPLERYAVFTENTGQWRPLVGSNFSIRVEGERQSFDTDGDRIDDINDNCTLHYNPSQRDTNGDGYGNDCDPDLNNDGIVNFLDIALWTPDFGSDANGDTDFNDDGMVNFLDYINLAAYFLRAPGPSGLVP